MKVYLSGRMSGLPENIWYARFFGAECGLARMGLRAVNPADTMIARHPWLYKIVGYRWTLWYDLQLLKRCDLFTMVGDDWQKSRGARLERMKAGWSSEKLKQWPLTWRQVGTAGTWLEPPHDGAGKADSYQSPRRF